MLKIYLLQISVYEKPIYYINNILYQSLEKLYFNIKTAILYFAKEKTNITENEISKQAERIFNEYGNSILRIAYSYLHNMTDAEDILQDTLIQFLKKTPCFENKNHEKAWLLRVAINLSKNKIKYNSVRSADELNETLTAEHREDLSFVWEAVKMLPINYRETIHLFYYEGYSTSDIAKILNKNESTIRSYLHRGRDKLKDILKESYDFYEEI